MGWEGAVSGQREDGGGNVDGGDDGGPAMLAVSQILLGLFQEPLSSSGGRKYGYRTLLVQVRGRA